MKEGQTWALWSLREAVPQVREGLRYLRSHGAPDVCYSCGEEKPWGLVLWIGDAGKFYETFLVEEVIDAADTLFEEITIETGFSTVTLINSRRV